MKEIVRLIISDIEKQIDENGVMNIELSVSDAQMLVAELTPPPPNQLR